MHGGVASLSSLSFSLYGNYMLLMCLAYLLPYFSASVVMMQFMNMILVIQERLAVINK